MVIAGYLKDLCDGFKMAGWTGDYSTAHKKSHKMPENIFKQGKKTEQIHKNEPEYN